MTSSLAWLLAEDVVADPCSYFGRLRQGPVHWNESHGSWILTRYQDVTAALLDTSLSSERVQVLYDEKLNPEEQAALGPKFAVLSDWMVLKDPPDHTRLRNLVKRAFTPRAVATLAPQVESNVQRVLDRTPEQGTVELLRDIAFPVPAMVIAEMLGVPVRDRGLLRGWSGPISLLLPEGRREPGDRDRAHASLLGLRDPARHYGQSPRYNLLSALVHERDAGDALTEDEIVHGCVLLMFAGDETTTNLVANGFLALAHRPNQRELLDDPSLVPPAVAELNRFDGPAKMPVRRAAADLELHRVRLRAGGRGGLAGCTANRGPRRFDDPESLDLERTDNRHVTFGLGIRYCLGAPVARLEAQVALPRISADTVRSGCGPHWSAVAPAAAPARLGGPSGRLRWENTDLTSTSDSGSLSVYACGGARVPRRSVSTSEREDEHGIRCLCRGRRRGYSHRHQRDHRGKG